MCRHKPFIRVGVMLTVDDVVPSGIQTVIVVSLIRLFDGRNNQLHHTFKELVTYWFGDYCCCRLCQSNNSTR